MSHTVVLAAGGTGGHVFPAQALGSELTSRGLKVALVTDERGGVHGQLPGISEVHLIRAGGLAGKGVAARIRSALALTVGLVQARSLLKRLRPEAVVGFGGYASVPTMLAAGFGGFRAALHEQNAILGRANRLLASRVMRIATSFEGTRGLPSGGESKVLHTGMPVRPAIAEMRGRDYPKLQADGPVHLVVLGGSQGAQVFSQIIPAAVTALPEALRGRLRITQQCRPEDLDAVRAVYAAAGINAELSSFFDDVPERIAGAHLVIARSGASTVAELLAVGRPAILVPYPHAIDDHQAFNAHAVADAGAGWLMPQEAFTAEALAERMLSLIGMPATLVTAAAAARANGRADAAVRLADMVGDMLPANGEPGGGSKVT